MRNKDYNIFGKIISVISNDYPPRISHKFADRVMDKIYLYNKNKYKNTSYSFLNIAASIFFAVITTYTLVNYNEFDTKPSTITSNEVENEENNLIRRVIDKDSCSDIDNQKRNENVYEKCK